MNGGAKVLRNGEMSPRRTRSFQDIINRMSRPTSAFMICVWPKPASNKRQWRVAMASTVSVITTTGSTADGCWSVRSKTSSLPANPIFHFVFVGRMIRGRVAGWKRRRTAASSNLQRRRRSEVFDADPGSVRSPCNHSRRQAGISRLQRQASAERRRTTRLWRNRVRDAGLPGIHLIAVETAWDLGWDATAAGFDAKVLFQPQFGRLITHGSSNGARHSIPGKDRLQVYDYRAAVECIGIGSSRCPSRYETVVPNWDNTARVGEKRWDYMKVRLNCMNNGCAEPSIGRAEIHRTTAWFF